RARAPTSVDRPPRGTTPEPPQPRPRRQGPPPSRRSRRPRPGPHSLRPPGSRAVFERLPGPGSHPDDQPGIAVTDSPPRGTRIIVPIDRIRKSYSILDIAPTDTTRITPKPDWGPGLPSYTRTARVPGRPSRRANIPGVSWPGVRRWVFRSGVLSSSP